MADAHNSANRNTGGVILAIASLVFLLVVFNLTSSNIKLTDFESLEKQLTITEKNQKDSLGLLGTSENIVKELGAKKIVNNLSQTVCQANHPEIELHGREYCSSGQPNHRSSVADGRI